MHIQSNFVFGLILPLLFFNWSVFSQNSKALNEFSVEDCSFMGSREKQAQYLLRTVKPMARIEKDYQTLPKTLGNLLNDSIKTIPSNKLEQYLRTCFIEPEEVGGDLNLNVSKNNKGIYAKYLVIHDVSSPNYLSEDFPGDINLDSWPYNDVKKKWNSKKAHVFIGRTGKSFSPVNFDIPWRATKFEVNVLDPNLSKGLFLHIELVQPRKSDPRRWKNNDVIAPQPGFTDSQYERLALVYICASSRANLWLVPIFHSVLDEGLNDVHDDPQNFSLVDFNTQIEKLLNEINQ